MTPQQAVDRVKLRLNDEVTPRTFDDDDILVALNKAQIEFARKTLCLAGDTLVTGGSSSGFISLPSGAIWITAVSTDKPLTIATQHELDLGYFDINGLEAINRFSNWRIAKGNPSLCLVDYGNLTARLVPKPLSDVGVNLEYYRIPLVPIAIPSPSIEIPSPYHADLVIGALAYLFDVPDHEFYDREMAVLKLAAWRKRIATAARLLQTGVRTQTRFITPPPGRGFIQPTIGIET